MRGRIAGLVVALVWALFAAFGASGASAQERAAFYYPWFPETENWATKYHPTLGNYDSSEPAIIAKHIDMAKYARLDAFIASWWGQGSKTDQRLGLLLDGAKAKSFQVAPYYEMAGSSPPTSTVVASAFDYLYGIAQARGPEWLRVNGKPVLFLYNAAAPWNTCSGIADVQSANAGRFYLSAKLFSGYASCGSQPDSWHQYGPAQAIANFAPVSVNVSPGFDQCHEATPRLARDLARFKQNLATMVASGATWQLVTSFNEWCEGTAVEPAIEWASASGMGDYLDAMRAAFGGAPVGAGRTTDATGVTDTSATLNGEGSCAATPCTGWFQVSKDGFATWTATPHVTVDGAGFKLSQNVAGLTAGATYEYRLATSENGGATRHWDSSGSGAPEGTNYTRFTTGAPPPPPPDHTPAAAYTFSPASPQAGDTVHLDASSSTCEDTPCTYAWSEGATTLGTGAALDTAFTAGDHTVAVTVTDTDGDADSASHTITVTASPPPPATSFGQTLAATNVGYTTATMHGQGSCAASPCTAWFELSKDNWATVTTMAHQTVTASGFKLDRRFSGLRAGTAYQVRMLTQEKGGTIRYWDSAGVKGGKSYTTFTTRRRG